MLSSKTTSSISPVSNVAQVPLALKITVFVMGGLILLGLGMVGAAFMNYSARMPSFGEVKISLPPGTDVESVGLDSHRLLILTTNHADQQWLLLRSLKDGRDLGTLKFTTSGLSEAEKERRENLISKLRAR